MFAHPIDTRGDGRQADREGGGGGAGEQGREKDRERHKERERERETEMQRQREAKKETDTNRQIDEDSKMTKLSAAFRIISYPSTLRREHFTRTSDEKCVEIQLRPAIVAENAVSRLRETHLVGPSDDLVIDVGDVHAQRHVVPEEVGHHAPKDIEVQVCPRWERHKDVAENRRAFVIRCDNVFPDKTAGGKLRLGLDQTLVHTIEAWCDSVAC